MVALPTVVGLVESRKCVGSPLVTVSVALEGGAAPKLTLPLLRRLLPTMKLPPLTLMLIGGAVTVAGMCTGWFAGVKTPVGMAKLKLVVPAAPGTKLRVDVV